MNFGTSHFNHFTILILIICSASTMIYGQAVGINESGADPDASAILDVSSPSKGVLFPRMSEQARLSIVSPAEGLMVWDTTYHTIWGYDGSDWKELASKWERTTGGIKNKNADNIGIGDASSSYSLYINKPVPGIGFYDADYPTTSGSIEGDSSALLINARRNSTFSSGNPGDLILQTTGILGGGIPLNAGNVGIGTYTPNNKLTLNGDMGFYDGSTQFGRISAENNNMLINAGLGIFVTPADDIVLQYTNGLFSSSGNVGIGIIDPQAKLHVSSNVLIGANAIPAVGYSLSVDGRIMAEEMRIEDSGGWPDYVFREDYRLKSLPELKAEITSLGHLPGIPSAAEIEEEGIMTGEMHKLQMEKIEELTLYILELHERIENLEQALYSETQKKGQ